MEVDHGPFVVDNNLFLSGTSLLDMSEGGAYAHNLFAGKIISRPELKRATPFHPAHQTAMAGLVNVKGGDNRFFNNILVGRGPGASEPDKADPRDPLRRGGYGLWVYDEREFPLQSGGNVYYNAARPYAKETNHVVRAERDPKIKLVQEKGQVVLQLDLGPAVKPASTTLVTTALLGKAKIPGLAYENADGSAMRITTDFFGKKWSKKNPGAGPFANPAAGLVTLKTTL